MKNKTKLYFIYMPDNKGKNYALYYLGQEITWYRMKQVREANLFVSKREALNYIRYNNLECNYIHLKIGCLKSKVL